jgi:hypothetical protein
VYGGCYASEATTQPTRDQTQYRDGKLVCYVWVRMHYAEQRVSCQGMVQLLITASNQPPINVAFKSKLLRMRLMRLGYILQRHTRKVDLTLYSHLKITMQLPYNSIRKCHTVGYRQR